MPATTQAAAGPRRARSAELAGVAVFAGLTAALGLVPALPVAWSPVPVTAQSLGCMLAGNLLGARRAFASQALFLALVAAGLPLLSGGRGGLGVVLGPSSGFLFGYVITAGAVGWLTERCPGRRRWPALLVVNLVAGVVLLDLLGALGFWVVLRLSPVACLVMASGYAIGGLLKAVLAAVVAEGVHASLPGLMAANHRPAPTPRHSRARQETP